MDDSILAKFPDDDCVLGPFLGNLPTVKVAVAAGVVGFVAGRLPTVAAVVAAGVVGFVAGRRSRPATILSTSDAPVATRRELGADPALSVDHVPVPFLDSLPPEILDVVVQKLGWFQTTFAMTGRTCREAVERVASTRAVLTEEEREILLSWPEEQRRAEEQRRRLQSQEITSLAIAAVEGDVEALQWLIQLFDAKNLKWRDYGGMGLSCLAAARGQLESLKCLRANGCPWEEETCSNAAWGGHLGVLQWARQNGCPWNAGTCAVAAKRGHLEVLQWARQNRCPWDRWTCMYAARGGHLEVLQWARQNGCPWDHDVWSSAHPRCRPYLIYHGCPGLE
jgi:hypothetical protein